MIQIINDAVAESVENSKHSIDEMIKQVTEKRGQGERR